MRKNMKRCVFYPALVLLIFSCLLIGCTYEGEDYIGLYNCERLILDGENFNVKDVYPDGFSLELLKRGQAWLEINGERFYGRWTADGDRISLDIAGELSYARIEEGFCSLNLAGSKLEHGLLIAGASFPEESTVEEKKTDLNDRQLFWLGDWYGCWQIINAGECFADQNGQFFDCFARISLNDDTSVNLVFWDELQSADSPIAKIQLVLSDSGDNNIVGAAVSTGGYFLDSEISETQWSLEPGWNGFDSIIAIENGHYEGEKGSFDYNIILRPWGRTWEDVDASQPQLMPYFYYDWYLPMLSRAESMPDVFTPPDTTIIRNLWISPEETVEEQVR